MSTAQTADTQTTDQRTVSAQLLRDAYDAMGDLMPGIGGLAISADQIARINKTFIALEQAGVRQIPDSVAKKTG